MSITTGSLGMVPAGSIECYSTPADMNNISQINVNIDQTINVTFETLPSGLHPPFNVSQILQIPEYDSVVCGADQQIKQINQTWFEYKVSPHNTTGPAPKKNMTFNDLGQQFVFVLVQASPVLEQNPFWVSPNYSITNATAGYTRHGGADLLQSPKSKWLTFVTLSIMLICSIMASL